MKFWIILWTIILFMVGCSSRYYMRRGDVIYETGRFFKASSKYDKAYNKTRSKTIQANAALKAGQSLLLVNHPKEAYNWFRRVERANPESPEIYLKIAQASAWNDEPEIAAEYYQKYEELFGDGKGKDGLYYLEQVNRDKQGGGRYQVKLRKEFNSRYSDFTPVYMPEDTCTVYFASTRTVDAKKRRNRVDPVTGDGYSHIFKTAFVQEVRSTDKSGKVKVKRFPEPRWLQPAAFRDSLYSSRNEGAMCFTPEGHLYFTSSRLIDGKPAGTRIYMATRKSGEDESGTEQETWTSVKFAGVCGDSVSIGHPALTSDGQRLYFVSDQLDGGFGGKDIWYVDLEDGKWGTPVNAGELINTPGNEMFPYIRDNGELYFASDGHYGFGGLDLYKVEETEGNQRLIHLPSPLNSFADDFGIVFKPGMEEGLLTSGRMGRSDDIFGFNFIPQQLHVKMFARNAVTEIPVIRANVTVTADDGNISYLETDSTGMVSMEITRDKEYVFVTEHERYLKGKGIISTYREKADRLYELQVDMQPIEKPIVIPDIYFDVAKWELRPDAMENLKVLQEILKDNPNITIELSAHTDMVGNDQANMILSENRAQAVVDYLIEQGVYWDRLEAKGYGETQPRQINEKDAREYSFLKTGDILNERFVNRLRGDAKEIAMQLNRRIEFKVLRTNYKPGPNSLHNPNQKAVAAEEGVKSIGHTQLKDLKAVQGKFFTLQLGIFRNVPAVINQFRVVFTEKLKEGTVRYCTGIYDTREEAVKAADILKQKGIECLIKEFNFVYK